MERGESMVLMWGPCINPDWDFGEVVLRVISLLMVGLFDASEPVYEDVNG